MKPQAPLAGEFICTVCGEALTSETQLNAHIKCHFGENLPNEHRGGVPHPHCFGWITKNDKE